MQRLAVLADVHGNLPALEAVLDDLATQQVDEVLIGGDLVGRGPEGSKVVARVRELGLESIGGNHEDYLLDFRHRRVPDEWLETEQWAAARWMAAELDAAAVEFIEGLPFALERPGLRLVHGTPRSNRHGIGPWTGDAELEGYLAEVPEPVLLCAHTHRPFERRLDAGMVVNVGSVGLPFDGDRRAHYVVLRRGGPYGWRVEPRRVAYDLDEIFAVYERTGFLAEGGVTSRLLRLELEHAVPLLVPFLEWAKIRQLEPTVDQLGPFLAFHPPGTPLRTLFRRLQELAEA